MQPLAEQDADQGAQNGQDHHRQHQLQGHPGHGHREAGGLHPHEGGYTEGRHGGGDAGHQARVIQHAHADDLQGEHRGGEGRAEQGGEHAAHAAQGGKGQVLSPQAQELARRGYREIVVTGIEIASWGADLPGKPAVTELIEAVCNAVPALRVRLGSLEPRIVTEDFCRRLSRLPNLCPQFHLSMQSGCDTVLQRMRRKYDTARYYESVCLLRTWFPGCAVTTDMIVAFPGETEDEFAQSLAFIRKCGFAEMHIFPYSRRPGTPADKMPGQHGNAVKEERSRAAIAVAEEMSRAYREALIGSVQNVLFEDMEDGLFTGHAPNYVKVYVPGEGLHNQVHRVRITGLYKDGLTGSLEP